MSIMLPGELVWVLNLIGVNWPDVDEDKLRETGTHFRQYADSVESARQRGDTHINGVADQNEGEAAQALIDKWANRSSPNIAKLHTICYDFADALDIAATAVEVAKDAVIAQLGALAVEVLADQAGAIETFGLTEAAAAAEVTATRTMVKDILKALEKQLIDQVLQEAKAAVIAGVEGMVSELVFEATADALGTGNGIHAGSILNSGVAGTVDSAKQSVASYTTADGLEQHAEQAAEGAVSSTKDQYSQRGAEAAAEPSGGRA
ncbi:uncharacterized protein YukE [Streptacidiphilus sp. MAP12-33]|uniref:WXG100-like domain-containing protein n=1 Tax=Streptacidiphilus sp. MAP12-33 TaxID=3156266 RepID=UPI003515F0C4